MKKVMAFLLSACMILSLAACGNKAPASSGSQASSASSGTAAETKLDRPIEIKLCAIDPADQNTNDYLRDCIAEITERTNGMIDIQLYTDGQMLVYAEGVEAVMSNANVIVVSQSSYLSDYFPVMAVFGSPYVFPSREVATAFYNSDYFAGLKQECEDGGVHIICADALTGFRSMITTSPVTSVDDLRKLNLRIAGLDGLIQLFENMNCAYQVFPFGECFNALQTGAIDGLENTPTGINVGNFYDAAFPLYYDLTNHILDGYFLITGHDFWMSIPEEYRTVLDEVLGGWGKTVTDNLEAAESDLFDLMKSKGVEVIEIPELSEFKSYAEPIVKNMEGGEDVLKEIARIEAEIG